MRMRKQQQAERQAKPDGNRGKTDDAGQAHGRCTVHSSSRLPGENRRA
jgi:hypothetical protein